MTAFIGRRAFIMLLGGAAAARPLAARAQQPPKVWRIGLLQGASRSASSGLYAAFVQGMRDLGYTEGKDFVIEWRSVEGRYEQIPEVAAEFVRAKVDVIVTALTAALPTLKQAITTIPIVMATSTDPVGNGLVASLVHPGGNMTGLAGSSDDSAPKQLELLATVVPNVSRIGLLGNPNSTTYHPVLKSAQDAARKKASLSLVPIEVRSPQEIENAFAAAVGKERVQAVMAAGDAVLFQQRQQIAELALRNHLPSMFPQREYAAAGGLMSYGENLADFFRRAASYVDKIFKGAKPGELPIEQPTRFHLVINRKTADALGVTIPAHLYIFADEVIE
jgi:putative tryptophan/tyrosine transport system substrate-binding protein